MPKWVSFQPVGWVSFASVLTATSRFGLVIPQGIAHVAKRVPEFIEDERNELPGSFRLLVQRLLEQLKGFDHQVHEIENQIVAWHRANENSCKLAKMPGIGPITASAW